jgi:electron transfer flavoprotein alpha subunit
LRNSNCNGIWIFGDHRNYFQDRVTLQLIARAKELAGVLHTYVGVVLLGWQVDEYVLEYTAHGADKIFLVEHEALRDYSSDLFTDIITDLVRDYCPEIFLISGSDFGREIAPRIGARLLTGVTSDCIALQIDDDGSLVQISPAFDGNALAEIRTERTFPQIATVRPGVFSERKHDYRGEAELVRVNPDMSNYRERVRVLSSRRAEAPACGLERAECVVCAGKGVSRRDQMRKVQELADILQAELGCTRPLVEEGKMDHERLIGQTGRTVKPELLVIAGASGAVQFTAAIRTSRCVIAINRDPNAAIFKYCDIGVVGDAAPFIGRLVKELKG